MITSKTEPETRSAKLETTIPELLQAPIPDAPSGKQPIRILVCGLPNGVNRVVHQLHLLGFAEASEWSPALPSPIAGEVIRILVRYHIA
ncbi:hypothetical protein [Rivularia sp. UHCC 0363]|uniref:hypothetical protein n=1 Tax=Rivularia sp. UHCC 0363 TaxID=3110244 RepID=UPI002B1EC751|nr:hypothetical protein [Rivularia sp. UHCC 0363]MEA5597328.1 hypothetical protein [Rivularia sp. UHCC 0363]